MKKVSKFSLKRLGLELNFNPNEIKILKATKLDLDDGYKFLNDLIGKDLYTVIYKTKNFEKELLLEYNVRKKILDIKFKCNNKDYSIDYYHRDKIDLLEISYAALCAFNESDVFGDISDSTTVYLVRDIFEDDINYRVLEVCKFIQVGEYKNFYHLAYSNWYKLRDRIEDLDKFKTDYLEGRASNTKDAYYYSISNFLAYIFFYHHQQFPCFDEKLINRYIEYLKSDNKADSYINQIYNAITTYSQYAKVFLDTKKIKVPKLPNISENPKSLEDEKLEEIAQSLKDDIMFAEVDAGKDDKFEDSEYNYSNNRYSGVRDAKRNYIIFRVMLVCGLRISECLNLKINDINLEKKYIDIKETKTNQARRVPMTNALHDELVEYIAFRKEYDFKIYIQKHLGMKHGKLLTESRKNGGGDSWLEDQFRKEFTFSNYLFVSNRYQKVSPTPIMRVFQEKGLTSHQLRHTMVKNLVMNNVPIPVISRLSGHQSLAMINRYSQLDQDELQQIIEDTSKR